MKCTLNYTEATLPEVSVVVVVVVVVANYKWLGHLPANFVKKDECASVATKCTRQSCAMIGL